MKHSDQVRQKGNGAAVRELRSGGRETKICSKREKNPHHHHSLKIPTAAPASVKIATKIFSRISCRSLPVRRTRTH